MPTPTTYINDIKDIANTVTGATAPTTGQYYRHIYSQNDANTGVPTLGVGLYKDLGLEKTGAQGTAPIPLNNLTDTQILEMIQNGQQVSAQSQNNTLNLYRSNSGQYTQVQNIPNTQAEQVQTHPKVQDSGVPTAGIFMLMFLLMLVGFVYFIIRMWQDHQAQKIVMMSVKKKSIITSPEVLQTKDAIAPTITMQATPNPEKETSLASDSKADWRTEIEQAERKLKDLLGTKGIEGETISDKLKAVKPGQFALADMAWEAQQGAKDLLTAHDTDASEQAIKRTLQLFKQVFAEHEVV